MTVFPPSRRDDYLATISDLGFQRPVHQIARAYTDGVHGEAVAGRSGAAVIVGDFVELSGTFDPEVYDVVGRIAEAHLVEPPAGWVAGIPDATPDRFVAFRREAFRPMRPGAVEGPGTRAAGTSGARTPTIDGSPLEISAINHSAAEELLSETWSADVVANTRSVGAGYPKAFGFVARHNGRIIGAVGCFAIYRDGIEIQIDTREGFRRRGVATELATRMIAECSRRSLQCHWDAMTPASATLARRLGFVSERVYWCYELRAGRAEQTT